LKLIKTALLNDAICGERTRERFQGVRLLTRFICDIKSAICNDAAMAQAKVSMTGKGGVIVSVLVLGIAAMRFSSMASVDDPELQKQVLRELQNDTGREVGALIDESENSGDLTELADEVSTLVSEQPEIHAISVSKPLLSFSSSTSAVIKVEFSLPGRSRNVKYYRATDSLAGGWMIGVETSVTAFYLNLI